MTDPRTPTSDPVAAAWEGLWWDDARMAAFDRHRPLIEEAIHQQARAAFAVQVAAARFVATHWRDAFMDMDGPTRVCTHPLAMVLAALDGETEPAQLGLSDNVHDAFRALLAASPEPASPEAPGSGLDVERLARALYGVHAYRTLDDAKEVARDIVREYDRLAARPDGAEASHD